MNKSQQTSNNRRTIKLTAQDNGWKCTDTDNNTGRLRYEKDGFTIEIYPSTRSFSVLEKGGKPRWFKKAAWHTISRVFYCPWISTVEALKAEPIKSAP